MFRARRPTAEALVKLVDRAGVQRLTYAAVGATATGRARPPGYLHDEAEAVVGRGPESFAKAADALRCWSAQRGAGVEVFPEDARVEEGETTVLLIRVGPVWALAPCRVVYVEERPDTFVFAYGTLPGHPEQGEVAFSITLRGDGFVVFRIASFSRRAAWLARLGAPLARRLQQRVTRRYFDAVRAELAPEPD